MSLKRKLSVTAAAAGIAPVLLAVLPAEQASAHGYISTPGSRQAQCARHAVPCGNIQYEPQSVEGPKGQSNCNGGLPQFAELNDDSKPWKPTSVSGGTVAFSWTFTARHKTSNYQYFLGGRKIAEVDAGGKPPGAMETHQVNLGGATGRQKLLAVWNIADTPMAFYSCVDLQIGGGGSNPPSTEQPPTKTEQPKPTTNSPKPTTPTQTQTQTTQPPPASATDWKPDTYYAVNAEVTYQGARYRIIQRHTSLTGWEPTVTPALWQKLSTQTNETTQPTQTTQQAPASGTDWKPDTHYALGAEVTYQGARYRIIQQHTSMTGWEPTMTPALWQKL